MYKIRKEFHFSASHVLSGLPDDHPCSRLHGHNYIVTVELCNIKLNEIGFVIDYRALEPIKKWIDDHFDHRHINDVMPLNPSAESMAKFLYELWIDEFPQLCAVEVSETPKTTARYEPIYD
jgi:6-pyruvoyltetrahydropterin/6-carboxytetrahydropterin synthase